MDEKKINLRIKLGENELEVSGEYNIVMDVINKLLPYLSRESVEISNITEKSDEKYGGDLPPKISITSGEPLSEILKKVFNSSWGSKPRQLKEIISVLESYGLYYPKSSIAVTLKRLVQRGAIRRIKSKDKHYLYVSISPSGD